MQNGPMWEALCKTQTCQVQWVQWSEADLLQSPSLALTQYIQCVSLLDATKLVPNHAGIVATIRRHHTLHDQAPMPVPKLQVKLVGE